ncbi:MAG: hypothetical protein HY897_02645 [Deltaproteobacteria bacterium]|nr:hypothetical protein [Deltaproteobacteria bacterium]
MDRAKIVVLVRVVFAIATGTAIVPFAGCDRDAVGAGTECEQAADCAEGLWCLGRVCQERPFPERRTADGGGKSVADDGGSDEEGTDGSSETDAAGADDGGSGGGDIGEAMDGAGSGDISVDFDGAPFANDGEVLPGDGGVLDSGGGGLQDADSPDAGPQCAGDGEACALIPCCEGLACGVDDVCGADDTCSQNGGKCTSDEDCCRPGGTIGSWCGVSGTCRVCATKGGACESDYDCCYSLGPVMCTSRNRCQVICKIDSDCGDGNVCLPDGECTGPVCSADIDCNGQRCCSGECRDDCGYGRDGGG